MELKDSDNFIVGQVEALEIEMHQSLFAIKFVAWSVNVSNSHTVPKSSFPLQVSAATHVWKTSYSQLV